MAPMSLGPIHGSGTVAPGLNLPPPGRPAARAQGLPMIRSYRKLSFLEEVLFSTATFWATRGHGMEACGLNSFTVQIQLPELTPQWLTMRRINRLFYLGVKLETFLLPS